MIKILERYIAKSLLLASGMATLIITGVLLLLTFLSELRSIGEGEYGFIQATIYVFLRMPAKIYQFSPLLVLLGSIIGLSILSSHRELAVMRTSGFSMRRIIFSLLSAAFLLISVIGLVGELVAPHLSYSAELHKENAKSAGQAMITSTGVWLHVDNNFIHVQQVVGRAMLKDVTRYQFDGEHRLLAAYFVKKLTFDDHHWWMNDFVKTSFYAEGVKSHAFARAPWNLTLNPNFLNMSLVDPNEMSLPKLTKYANYLEQNGLRASEYRYEFWSRLFQPIVSLMMIFLAVPFVLGTLSASPLGWRIVVGIMVGFSFFIINAFLGQLCIVYQVPPLLAALLPCLLFGVVGLVLANELT